MALAIAARSRSETKGKDRPRIAPPLPARSLYKDAVTQAAEIGINFMPWQVTAERYIEAVGPGDLWLYPESAVIVGRQNGKTEILVPHIRRRLLMGRRIMHTAQNRELPREVFARVAEIMESKHGNLLVRKPRFANGQEEIRLRNGGHYRIVAPTRGGARGPSNDDVIADEILEMRDHEFIAAAEPTLSASPNPQFLYLSNMGDEDAVVLNALRKRAGSDPNLAFLEWSAAPERPTEDRDGWLESNPSVGYLPGKMEYLERKYQSYRLAGTLSIFETEHLCRRVPTRKPALVAPEAFAACHAEISKPVRPMVAVNMHPSGSRASAVAAWQQPDGMMAMQVIADVKLNTEAETVAAFAADLAPVITRLGAPKVAYDPLTDGELAKHLRRTEKRNGRDFANDCATFVRLVELGRLRWDGPDIGPDLQWATRKDHESGAWYAVPVSEDQPITTVLAAIRAVGMASGPRPQPPRLL